MPFNRFRGGSYDRIGGVKVPQERGALSLKGSPLTKRSHSMARKSFALPLAGVVIFLVASVSSADVRHMVNYQGKLTTATGECLNDTVEMTFSIYPDTLGSPADWTETQTGVVVKEGVFNVLLGAVDTVPVRVFDGSIKYLGVQVESDLEMTPLRPIVSVAYAYRASTTDAAGGWVDDGTVVRLSEVTDQVGIGTPSPAEKLDVDGNILASGTISSGSSITIDGTADRITASSGSIDFEDENLQTTGGVDIGAFKMPTGSATGLVLTSDGEGNGTWQGSPEPNPMYQYAFVHYTGGSGTMVYLVAPPDTTTYITGIWCYSVYAGVKLTFEHDGSNFMTLGTQVLTWSSGGGAPIVLLPGQSLTGVAEGTFSVTITGYKYPAP